MSRRSRTTTLTQVNVVASRRREQLAMLRVLLVRAAAGYPLRSLVPVGRDAPAVYDHPRQMRQVPGHESRIPVREVVLGTFLL